MTRNMKEVIEASIEDAINLMASEVGVDLTKRKPVKRLAKALAQRDWDSTQQVREYVDQYFRTSLLRQPDLLYAGRGPYDRRIDSPAIRQALVADSIQSADREQERFSAMLRTAMGCPEPDLPRPGRGLSTLDRQIAAAQHLGWGWIHTDHDETNYIVVGPDARLILDWDGEAMIVADEESWFDIGQLVGVEDYMIDHLTGWLHVANVHSFSFPSRWNLSPAKCWEWLRTRKPSRKGLEKKFRKFAESLPAKFDWSNRQDPIVSAVGWHCANDNQMMVVGCANRWCFGSTYHARYVALVEQGCELWFVPSDQGLLACFRDLDGDWVEVKLPGNEEGGHLLDAILEEEEALQAERRLQERCWSDAEHYWEATGY